MRTVASQNKKSHPINWMAFDILVESAGIGHPGQPWRLHAPCRSWARRMRLETPDLHFAACKLFRFVRQITARRCCYLSALIPASRRFVSHQINKNKKPPDEAGWFYIFGGVGGNRTRVQKHSTDSSTYLVLPFDLILTTRTHTLRQDELPII